MKDLIVYVHGKGGSAGEAAYYKTLFPNREVIGFDYRSQTPWEAKKEFLAFFTEQRGRCEHLTLVANSIGAFFALSSLDQTMVDRAYFISPIVDIAASIWLISKTARTPRRSSRLSHLLKRMRCKKKAHSPGRALPGESPNNRIPPDPRHEAECAGVCA